MNDRRHASDPYGGEYASEQYGPVSYDEYGRPIPQQPPQGHDPYAGQQQGYGYDPYQPNDPGTGQQPPVPADPYAGQQQDYGHQYQQGYDPYGQGGPGTGQQPPVPADPYAGQQQDYGYQYQQGYDPYGQGGGTGQQPRVPEQQPRHDDAGRDGHEGHGDPGRGGADDVGAPDYRTEQFSFIEEPDEESEDVIDWLAFTESRTERREEAKRRGRSRMIALVVVAALVLAGGVGYLWYAGKLPGTSSVGSPGGAADTAGPQKRDVIMVHLHDTRTEKTSTVLLVDNTTSARGATVLLPNSLALTGEDGSPTTLEESVDDDGSTGTREAVDQLLGTSVEGTWRLDTPYLNNLVELVGNIELDADATVPAAKKGESPLVTQGADRTLGGPAAVAYATYRAKGEPQTAQLDRFGQVFHAVLRKLSSDPQAATVTVETLAQILDPSLKEKDLGAFLARLADRAKGGDHTTELLPVGQDGRPAQEATDKIVKQILGGSVSEGAQGDAARVGVQDATGTEGSAERARASLVNGGYAYVGRGGDTARATSAVTYEKAADKAEAVEVARTLGLPESAVTKGSTPGNVDVSVVLGADYRPGD
ncbi:LytR C-terminal domain-containing protein [Streptomyces diastaticus]|uniref:LytR C-terminal domain-containing protein n=1 Tax=Streptomyces diastaticus TaxID=1956 RepID=UPI00342355E5